MLNEDATLNELKLINIRSFKSTLGVSHNKFYELRNRDPKFPRPVKLGARPMYRFAEVKAYIETLELAPNMGAFYHG